MTWFAHQVFAEPRPDVIAPLRHAFGDALFRVADLPAHWSPGSAPLSMPTQGLLVVRELCAPPGDDPSGVHPPLGLLLLLRRISVATDSVVSLYCAGYWGGDIEYAQAWTFTGDGGGGRVHLHTVEEGRDAHGSVESRPAVRSWDQHRPQDAPEITLDGDVLTLVLDHHDVHLDGGYFAAHSRSFDWSRYRLDR
ncbi:hypothetical protein [Cellulomonas sp. Leaf334]|uniref:hypothetical protein n=1 Tax=Cellulomonas sp. Leaf334 TaxID=1736339 RepID=UPI0007010C0D|nr:hypothetical protein [Cellulomonas sp. Leaf334]KQR17432.1 hypothetical protein ASF78_09150 [Cellulomonas sp. Leaf334]